MNKITRTFFQLLFWFFIWVVFGLSQASFSRFMQENWIVYLFQVLLLFGLTYFLAPKLLFKNKYFVFAVLSVGSLVVFAFVSTQFITMPNHLPVNGLPFQPPPHSGAFEKRGMPSPFFINFLILTVTYVSAIFLETFVFAQKKEEALILSKSETMETELKFLKSQINPHFLFNSLNNIYALSAIDSQRTQESILYLSDMLRYVLYECEKPKVAIENEITYIEDFIKLFKLKSSKSYPIKTKFSVENPHLQITPMLLIPFVENAFKHSNIYNTLESFISIEIVATNDSIVFVIENSVNKEPVSKDAVGGIGIRNVKKRLSLLYPDHHELEITENSTTFRVELKLDTHV